jgi:hypothetical protein
VREVAAHEVLDALRLVGRSAFGRNAAASLGRQPVDEIDLALFSSHAHWFSRCVRRPVAARLTLNIIFTPVPR